MPETVTGQEMRRQLEEAGQNLSHCCALAQRVAATAGKASLFEDRGREISLTSQTVKSTIAAVHAQLDRVEATVKSSYGEATAPAAHWAAIVGVLRLEAKRIAAQLQSSLRIRAHAVRRRARLASRHASAVVTGGWVPNTSMEAAASRLHQPAAAAEPVLRQPAAGATYLASRMQAAAVHRRAVARLEEAEEVERAVVEVGAVVQHVAQLVDAQGSSVDRIDTHLYEAKDHLDASELEVGKLLQVVSRNRAILIALLVITAIVLVTMMLLAD